MPRHPSQRPRRAEEADRRALKRRKVSTNPYLVLARTYAHPRLWERFYDTPNYWGYGTTRHTSVVDYLSSRSDIKSVIDLGCNDGTFLRNLIDRRAFERVVGVDIAPAVLKRAQAQVPSMRAVQFDLCRLLDTAQNLGALLEHCADVCLLNDCIYYLGPRRFSSWAYWNVLPASADIDRKLRIFDNLKRLANRCVIVGDHQNHPRISCLFERVPNCRRLNDQYYIIDLTD